MQEYQKKHKVRKFMYSKFVLVFLLVCIVFLSKGVLGMYAKTQESKKNKQTAEIQYSKLEAREAIVATQLAELKTPQGIEKEIRSKFNVTKEGEKMVVIVEEESTADDTNGNKNNQGFFGTIKAWFIDNEE